jgi:beta-lactamase class A
MSSRKWGALMLLGMVASACVTWLALKPSFNAQQQLAEKSAQTISPAIHDGLPCDDVTIVRDNDPSLTKPLLLTEVSCESDALRGLKEEITAVIDSQKANGKISRASVYFKELNSLHWTSAYGNELYYPGSMLKVPIMLCILKQAQRDKTLLERKLEYRTPGGKSVVFPVQSPMVPGNFYTVQELIERMIVFSDNDATTLLFSVYDKNLYDDLFMKLSVPVQDPEDRFYRLSTADMAKFLRVLYNSSYLSSLYSEYALSLLTKSDFTKGILQGVSDGTKVAHKFGERYTTGDLVQLHETAIVYRGSASYVITVMTEGKNMEDLSSLIGEISKVCFSQKNAQVNDLQAESKQSKSWKS